MANKAQLITRHNHDFWFSDVRYQFPPPRQHIEEITTLIIDFYHLSHSGFFSSEAFDKRTNRVSTDVADKHACYISEIAT